MQVILQKEVSTLGREGDVVNVAQGYANNFLIPKGLAIIANRGNLKQLEQKQGAIAKRETVIREEALKLSQKIGKKPITMKVKTGKEGRLFGSITAKDIAAAINAEHQLTVDRRRIQLSEPIKQVGETIAILKLHPDIEAVSLKLNIISESPAEETESQIVEDAAKEE